LERPLGTLSPVGEKLEGWNSSGSKVTWSP